MGNALRRMTWFGGLLLVSWSTSAGTEYFVGEGPLHPNWGGPFGIAIYEVDTLSDSLHMVWSLPEGDYYCGIKIYPAARVAVVFAGPWGYVPPDKLYIVPFDSVSSASLPVLDYRGSSTELCDSRYIDNGDGRFFLNVSHRNITAAPGKPSGDVLIDLSTHQEMGKPALASNAAERLTGCGPADWPNHRVAEFRRTLMSRDGDGWTVSDSAIKASSVPIPDSVVKMKTSYGWNLIATEPAYYAITSVPERGGLASQELLVYNRPTGTWNSLLIPGAHTALRLLGGWLAGVVQDPNPDTDFDKRFGGPPVPRGAVVLVAPVGLRMFTVDLGQAVELLAIEGDTVYYRLDSELYHGRIKDNNIVDRTFILKNMQVRGINWAFSGREQ